MRGGDEFARWRNREELVICQRDTLPRLDTSLSVWRHLDLLIEGGRTIKHDHVSTVVVVEQGGRDWIIKRYNHRGLWYTLRQWLAGSRGLRALRHGLLLRSLGIATPRALLCAVRRRRGLPWCSYVVNERSPGEPLCDLFDRGELTRAEWPHIAARVRDQIHRLHALGITHGDVKTPNLLWDGEHLEIIDLDALRLHRWRHRFERFRAKDQHTLETRVDAYPERGGIK